MTQVSPPEENSGLSMRQMSHLVYGLFALGLLSGGFFGVATIAAIILAYLKRSDAAGTIYAAHLDWVIRTFWWGLLWLVLSGVALVVFVGWLTGFVAIVWIIYRIIRGWLAMIANEPPVAGF